MALSPSLVSALGDYLFMDTLIYCSEPQARIILMCPRTNNNQEPTLNWGIKSLSHDLAYLTVFCTTLRFPYLLAAAEAAAVRCGNNELSLITSSTRLYAWQRRRARGAAAGTATPAVISLIWTSAQFRLVRCYWRCR